MSNESEQQMNVERPDVASKAVAWGLFAVSFPLLCASLIVFPSAWGRVVVGMLLGPIVACGVIQLTVAYGLRYCWDDEEIHWKCLWRERSLRWDEITGLEYNPHKVVLIDTRGVRLSVALYLLGERTPLHRVLLTRWTRIQQGMRRNMAAAVERRIEASGEARFPADWPEGVFTLRENKLIYRVWRRTREISLDDIARVSNWGRTLESRSGETITVPSNTPEYAFLISYIREHAVNAVWFDPTELEPADPAQKAGYLRRQTEMLRKRTRGMWAPLIGLVGVAVYMGVMVCTGFSDGGDVGAADIVAGMIGMCIFLLVLIVTAPYFIRDTCYLKDLRRRLAQLEAQEDAGKGMPAIREEERE
jgi:hypothetical protein